MPGKVNKQFRIILRLILDAPRVNSRVFAAPRGGSLRLQNQHGGQARAEPLKAELGPRPDRDRPWAPPADRRFHRRKKRSSLFTETDIGRDALPFDFPEGEFSHQGEDCTFETLLKRFGIADKHLRKIGEMVHDADLEDDKFQRVECIGIDRVLKGWAKHGMSDDELLLQGAACFDGLYSFLQRL